MTDLQHCYEAYRENDLAKSEMFLILLRHADEPDWHGIVDRFSEQERIEFEKWACDLATGYKTVLLTCGYHGPTEEERQSLRRRFEERGWLQGKRMP